MSGTTRSETRASGPANDISDDPPEPGDREERPEREQEPARGREQGGDLALALDRGELQVDRLVDLLEGGGVAGPVVAAVRHLRDLRQLFLVQGRRDVESIDLHDR